MAVYTKLPADALATYLENFQIGSLKTYEAITTGIENSNYRIVTRLFDEDVKSVLTIIEGENQARTEDVRRAMQHLAHYGLPVPQSRLLKVGVKQPKIEGKPTFLMQDLPGQHFTDVSTDHCSALGETLGRLHTTSTALDWDRPALYDSAWMSDTLTAHRKHLSLNHIQLIERVIDDYETLETAGLPRGLIHGDAFKDNVLFDNTHLVGLLDFFHISQDLWIMDLAIAINDWCTDSQGCLRNDHAAALLAGYDSARRLEREERAALAVARAVAAARFALTRLETFDGKGFRKDPQEQLQILHQVVAVNIQQGFN